MVLLLNPPAPKVVKDAARATKRVGSLTVEKVTETTLSELLGLPGMRVTHFAIERQDETQYLHLFCEHEYDVAICPRCQVVASGGYDHQDRCVRHLDIWEMKTLLHFPKRPFTENLTWIEPKRRQTQAFEVHIYERSKKTPRKHVALEEGLHESTVLKIFKRQAKKRVKAPLQQRVWALGVDEISLRKGHKHYALVLSDLGRRCVIDVLPNRQKDTFETWLNNLSEAERKAIKVVSMDMWRPYRSAAKAKLPHAQIVADRFHVMKQLNHQINLLRRALQRKAEGPLAEALKGSRWILLKKRSELKAEEEEKLQVIFEASAELRAIYLLKEEFRTICDKITNRAQAARFLRAWTWKARATGSRYLKRFVNTLANWWHEFLNYFDDRITQGFVEGINRAIRGIINRAFGFRDFNNFRLQVLVEHGET
jgi:transposase